MGHHYDMRLTIRDRLDSNQILKQIYIDDLVFKNPISPGDKVVLPDSRDFDENDPLFFSRVEEVVHSPGRSYLEAEFSSGCGNFDRIEKFLFDNYSCRDIL